MDDLEQAMRALGIEIPRAPPGLGSGGAAPYPSYPQTGWLQKFLAALGGTNTAGLPQAVTDSILTRPSYGEGETLPGGAGQQRSDAYRYEADRQAAPEMRTQELGDNLALLQQFYGQNQARPEVPANPLGWVGPTQRRYGQPLPLPAQRFPLGLY